MTAGYFFTALAGIAVFSLLAAFAGAAVVFRGYSGTWSMPSVGTVLLGALNFTLVLGGLFTLGTLVAAGFS